MIWSSFTDWLERLVRDHGLVRLLLGLGAVATALTSVGLSIGGSTLLAASACALIAILVLTVLAQYVDRVRLYKDQSSNAHVLDRYASELTTRQATDSFDILEWRENQDINKHGDTTIERWFTLKVGAAPLQTFWQRCYMDATNSTQDFRYQKKVKLSAHFFDTAGVLGVEVPTTRTWDGHSLRVFMHPYEAQAAGSEVRVRLRIVWPKYAVDLVQKGHVSPVEWTLRRRTGRLTFAMHLPSNCFAGSALAVTRHPGSPDPTQATTADTHTINFEMLDPPIGEMIGFRLQRAT